MATTTTHQPGSTPETTARSYRPQRLRAPVFRDYLRYFVGIPVMLGFVFSLVGTRLTNGMPYLDALIYMILHMFIAWWTVNLGATFIKFAFRSWQPPTIVICIFGLIVALFPAAFLFQTAGDIYAGIYPVFAANRYDTVQPGWTLDYLLHFLRYSVPVLPTFLAGVYGYRAASGVDWFSYAEPAKEESLNTAAIEPEQVSQLTEATASLIEGTKLPADAKLIAIKAEQHYIRIWSDQGKDLVRYRFKDLDKALQDCAGIQVHRSWWVNLQYVQSHVKSGRKLELRIDENLVVPVSLSYKNAVLAKLARA